MNQIFDFCVATDWEYDRDFVSLIEHIALEKFGLTTYIVEPFNLQETINRFRNGEVDFNFLYDSWMLSALILIIVLVGIISGSYPAIFLSSFSPLNTLKGRFQVAQKNLPVFAILLLLHNSFFPLD